MKEKMLLTPEQEAANALRMEWWKWCEANQSTVQNIPTFKDWFNNIRGKE